ncbi:MAG: GTP cyclohydrolase I FolE [Spirochaetaceae bacterium]|nr:GTP cyclohydrolase I FolE [Spirochaetaceae bacterium]MDE0227340.1 GTP cyclohydrolase I FolE [Spirochaetaceae bacterium]MDE0449530.1 GTP cyclohydrolase I FolE [Spirochaetaceae bacterium]
MDPTGPDLAAAPAAIEACYRRIIRELGEDFDREGLVRTPHRAARALTDLTSGYRENLREIINGAIFQSESDEMIMVRNIETFSLCEHHLLPFIGQCHVAYIPDGRIIGLSKIPRIVNHFARRLQIQERLTLQVAHAVQDAVGAQGVGVVMEASHLCVMMRGVEKQHSQMKTSCMLGTFRSNAATRAEFLQLMNN